jgi:hypothetical protein
MAEAPDPSSPPKSNDKAAAPAADPVVHQRTLIYSITGLLAITGILLSMAFKDACAKYGGESALAAIGAQCSDVTKLSDYLPDTTTVLAMLGIWAVNILVWEVRWLIRTWLPGVLGSAFVVLAIGTFVADRPLPLTVAYLLFGVAMIACSWGMLRDRREGWAFAVSMFGMQLVVHFFGTSVIREALGTHLALAVLPAMAVFLPAFLALATTPPGSPRYAPFATKPSK